MRKSDIPTQIDTAKEREKRRQTLFEHQRERERGREREKLWESACARQKVRCVSASVVLMGGAP